MAIASTFAAHGYEATRLNPRFVDLILAADRNLFRLGIDQAGAESILRCIGVHDIALALVVLAGRFTPRVLLWMAFWGVVTACSRVVLGGPGAIHHAVIRAANGGLPLVLFFHSTPGASMTRNPLRVGARFARAALPLVVLALPWAASAQAISGAAPGHLRVIWTEDPAHRATISWTTAAAGGVHEVHIDTEPRGGALGSYARTVAAGTNGAYSTGGGHYHQAEVTGLEPSTTYHFVVVSDGQVSPERHFVTAPADDRPFRLLSGGDSRKPGEADRRRINELMASLAEDDPTILAIAHGGDYIQSEEAWEEWDAWMADHARTFTASGRVLPIIPVRGNHEGDGVMYNEVFGFPGGPEVDYFATQLSPNAVLLNLDTNSSIGGEQADWLEAQLQAAQAGRWILASYHRPAYPAAKSPSEARQFWVPLFEAYDVDVALESDGHVLKRTVPIRNDRHDPTGVVYVGEGGFGVPQREPNDEWYLRAPGMAKSAHHVQLFSFTPGELKYEAILIDGTRDDSWVFQPKRAGTAIEPAPAPEEPGTEPEPADPGAGEEPTDPGDVEPAPGTPPADPGDEEPAPGTPPVDPGAPLEPQPQPAPEAPGTGDASPGGCAAAGGSFAGLGLAAVGVAALRRRRAAARAPRGHR